MSYTSLPSANGTSFCDQVSAMQPIAALLFFAASVLSSPTSLCRRLSIYPAPEPCTGNCTYIHDPSVVTADDGTFYRFSTNGNIAIASAPSYTGPWTYLGPMLASGSRVNIGVDNQELWAPDVFNLNGTWHVYYAVSVIGYQDSQIGLATSTNPRTGLLDGPRQHQRPSIRPVQPNRPQPLPAVR